MSDTREPLNGIICECITDCDCIEEMKHDLEWCLRRLVHTKHTYPDAIRPTTEVNLKRLLKKYDMESIL